MIDPRSATALVVAVALALGACSSGGDDAAGIEPPANPPTTDAPAAEAEAEAEAEPEPEPEPVIEPEPEPEPDIEPEPEAEPEPDASGPRVIEHRYGTTEVPADPARIVALSEEFLLADLLALGITPVASSSNEDDAFGGIDPTLTEGIEITTSATFNLEQLAGFRPDLILAYPVYIELVGYDALNQIAPTVAIGDDTSNWRERLELTAEALGIESLANERLAEFQAQHDAAAEVLDGTVMSIVTVFDPSFIRAYVGEGTFLVDVLLDVGVELVPDVESIDAVDEVGRVQLSLEQFGQLQGDVLLLLQRRGVEDAAAAEIAASPLWSTLPAVQNGSVITLDRLSYPGAAGAAAFVSDLAEAVEALR